MADLLEQIAAHAGKPATALTRRDIARWLVTAADAGTLPELRKALIAGGMPLSATFWQSAEALLDGIGTGEATPGTVRMWLEATGSEPTLMIGLLVWEDEDQRLPLADRLHAELVEHLEGRVRAGAIDPDRLLAGDEDVRQAYVGEQVRWLEEPLADGRTRMEALLDEEDEEFLEEWAEADADALEALDDVLAEVGVRPCPEAALRAACDRLRAGLATDERPYDLLATCVDLAAADLPADDEELWLSLAVGVLGPRGEPPDRYPQDMVAAWYARMHADWLGAIGELARRGPGTPADHDDLATYVLETDILDGEPDDDDEDAVGLIGYGFALVVELWEALGAVDGDGRLTALGWWGLPEAQRRTWSPER